MAHTAELEIIREALDIPQPTVLWRSDFELHEGRHLGVQLPPTFDLAPAERDAVAPSLAVFQLGESGDGLHLEAAAIEAGVDRHYRTALRLFIREEQEHARLLGLALDRLGEPRRTGHWTDGVFQKTRRMFGLRGEVLMLLVAEVIALVYYAVLRDGLSDQSLAELCGRIRDDESRHVDFHAATLPTEIGKWHRSTRWAARAIWNTVVAGSSLVVAMGHRAAITACGTSTLAFLRQCNRERRSLSRRLFSAA